MNQDVLIKYVKDFNSHFSRFVKSGTSVEYEVKNCGPDGAIIILHLTKSNTPTVIAMTSYDSMDVGFRSLKQNFVDAKVTPHFKGTNIMMDQNRIILIKDAGSEQWTQTSIDKDLKKILEPKTHTV